MERGGVRLRLARVALKDQAAVLRSRRRSGAVGQRGAVWPRRGVLQLTAVTAGNLGKVTGLFLPLGVRLEPPAVSTGVGDLALQRDSLPVPGKVEAMAGVGDLSGVVAEPEVALEALRQEVVCLVPATGGLDGVPGPLV